MAELYGTEPMGETAENIAAQTGITRAEQDAFAVESHRRAVAAIDTGRFTDEILPVSIPQKKGDAVVVSIDERPRRDTTLESLAKLKPSFKADGSVTAGNSSGMNDGAAAVLVMSAEKAQQLGLKPMARIISSATAGVEPRVMGMGPVPAVKKALSRAGLKISDIGLVELNEAFAVQALAVIRELGSGRSHHQCQRRRHCPGASAGVFRRAHPHHAVPRNEETRPAAKASVLRVGNPLCWRWAGRSHHRGMDRIESTL